MNTAAHAAIGNVFQPIQQKAVAAMQKSCARWNCAAGGPIGSGGKAKAAELTASVSTSTCFCSV